MTHETAPASSESRGRWRHGALAGGLSAITCRLDVRGHRSYELCVVPHWDPAAAVIERFDALTIARLRHAEIASLLREQGWFVIDHTAANGHAETA
jgi:hypothetical protein